MSPEFRGSGVEGETKDGWIGVREINIHYKVAGRGSPLILLHGGANDWHEWEFNIQPLSCDYLVYAPDLVGYGLSDRPEGVVYTINYFTDFLYDFMENLGLKSVALVGHSLGGMIALNFTLRFPQKVRCLILVDSAGLGSITLKGRFIVIAAGAIRKLLRRGELYPSMDPKGFQEGMIPGERLRNIKVPALIIWGDRDRYFSVSQAYTVHQSLPNSHLQIFKGCGHAPQRERAEEFNQMVCDFLGQEGNETASIQ
jgi:pimeloyl-ACP methyl ester carboxylesterase